MYSFAVVEDNDSDFNTLNALLAEYGNEKKLQFRIERFREAVSFLDEYKNDSDAIFFDIDMPHMDGITAATEMRKIDAVVPIIFTTNLVNYAVKGYSVNAFDFIVKPLNKTGFYIKMDRIISQLERAGKREITLSGRQDGNMFFRRINVDSLQYVEIMNHSLRYHIEGEVIDLHGKMKDVEEQLVPYGFFRCNHSYLVNLKHVRKVNNEILVCGNDKIDISRRKKNAFWTALTEYISGMSAGEDH